MELLLEIQNAALASDIGACGTAFLAKACDSELQQA